MITASVMKGLICRTTWLTKKLLINKLQRHTSVNITTQKPVPVGCAKRVKTELDAFSLLFSDEMMEMIVLFPRNIMESNQNAKNLTDTARTEGTSSSE